MWVFHRDRGGREKAFVECSIGWWAASLAALQASSTLMATKAFSQPPWLPCK